MEHLLITDTAPLDKGSKLEELVTRIRVRKGLKVLVVCRRMNVQSDEASSPKFLLSMTTMTSCKVSHACVVSPLSHHELYNAVSSRLYFVVVNFFLSFM